MPQSLIDIQRAIQDAGYTATLGYYADGKADVLRCYKKVTPSGSQGTAFWLTVLEGDTYLLSYGYFAWQIPVRSSPAEVAIQWLQHSPDCMVPPESVCEENGLVWIDFDEFSAMFCCGS